MLGPKEIRWTAPEFEYHSKDVGWYWLTVIVAIVIIGLALWQKNFLFAIFIAFAEVLVLSWGRRRPKELEFRVSDQGLEIDGIKHYPYGDFVGFAIKGEEIILRSKNKLSPYLKILAEPQKLPEIKKVLDRHLSEIEYEESLADHIIKILRF